MINELRKKIKEDIEKITGLNAFFMTASDDADYPYITFELYEWGNDINRHTIELTVDAWDKDKVKEIIKVIDDLDKVFKQYKENNSNMVLLIYHGSGKGFIDDDDKTIKRLERKYDVIVYEKGA